MAGDIWSWGAFMVAAEGKAIHEPEFTLARYTFAGR
jgi:hypothetical protein